MDNIINENGFFSVTTVSFDFQASLSKLAFEFPWVSRPRPRKPGEKNHELENLLALLAHGNLLYFPFSKKTKSIR